ncbi:MAG: methyltransferase [Phycisphaerae bacterium]|jgi:protein-S-isoprenylcysteine O-methyltransferase Ste14
MRTKVVAPIVVVTLVAALLTTFCLIGYVLERVIGLPLRLGLPWPLRLGGVLVLIVGFGMMAWIFKWRHPGDLFVSTFVTLTKVLRRAPLETPAGRGEPLVIVGPYRTIRHPQYAAVMLLAAGWWLALDYTFLLFLLAFLAVWFSCVVAPLEERELRALFGDQYASYARHTPRFIPFTRRRTP